jgi:hypothetical protein
MEPETHYKRLIEAFLKADISVDQFVSDFQQFWGECRDNGAAARLDPRFQRLVDRIFTSCDVYTPEPVERYEFDAEQLWLEVHLLAYIWWGLSVRRRQP